MYSDTIITCPVCSEKMQETMPTDARPVYYLCASCKSPLKAKSNRCCIYCSYGSMNCIPSQRTQMESK